MSLKDMHNTSESGQDAIKLRLKEELHLVPYIKGGITFACAIQGARNPEDVVAVKRGDAINTSEHQAVRMILTAMRFDPQIRCVAVVKHTESFLDVCESMILEIGSFDRCREPPGISTIDWGVAFCCEAIGGVPDIIYDRGCREKEPLIRIFGEEPGNVSARLNRIITRIINTTFTEE